MKNKDIISIIKSLPLGFMESTASELRTDYKAKRLSSIRLFTLLLLAFLRNSTMSQRLTCEQSSCEILDDLLDTSIPVTPLSHSSLADRLATMNPVFSQGSMKKYLKWPKKNSELMNCHHLISFA